MDRKIRNLLPRISAIVGLVICTACATGPLASSGAKEALAPTDSRIWPPPPDAARIRLVSILKRPADVGIRSSALGWLFNLVAGKKEVYMKLPQQVALGSGKCLYVTDHKERCVHIFNLEKKRYFALKKFEKEPFYLPAGVAEGDNGWIYVSDSISRKILVFDSKGKPLFDFGGPEVFQRPTGMVFISRTDSLYVADTLAHNLKVFDKDGKFLFQFGKRGESEGDFNFPAFVSSDGDERIYVTDTMNHRVQVFDSSGKFLSAFGKAGDTSGSFAKPKGVAVDSHGNIYVVDALHDVIQIFRFDGQLLLSFCEPGSDKGELWLPSGIAIDEQDRIYVADTYNKRIQIFQLLQEKKDSH